MNVLDIHDLLMWGAIIALVLLATLTGMWINRFFTYRAHRKALAELHRRALMAEDAHKATQVVAATTTEVREI